MTRGVLSVSLSIAMICSYCPGAFANSPVNFKIYSPVTSSDAPGSPDADLPGSDTIAPKLPESASPQSASESSASSAATAESGLKSETPELAPVVDASGSSTPAADNNLTPSEMSAAAPSGTPESGTQAVAPATDAQTASSTEQPADATEKPAQVANKLLTGYIKVVPTGTKIPIIMDTAVDSDTSQEGDEFEARTSEDLEIDGQIAVPAGSVIKGRIASLAAPRALLRSGSVALKFDTVTTPDNRQIPLVATLVARGGVVHARRGMKDIAMDTGTFALPTVAGLAIGAVAGNSSSSLGVGGGALIGAGVGAAVGLAVLLARKGSKIDVRPGDELKIELAEDLRMPTM